jgi:peptide/nickel transport system substrate-binding protein
MAVAVIQLQPFSEFTVHIDWKIAMASRKKMLGAFFAAFTVAASVVVPVTAHASNTAPTGDVVFVRNQDFATFDPDLAQNDSLFIQQQVFEGLYRGLPSGKGVEPWLAKSSSTSADGLTWTFKLRTDVKFTDGTQMTSADFKFSLDRATKGEGWGFINSAIDSVSAPAPDTLVIKTKYKWAPLLADLACFSNSVLPNNFGGKTEAAFFKSPVGTGPFMLDHWTPGTEIKLVANKSYWQPGKPYLNSVTWKYVADDNTREFMLKGGQADINEEPPAATIKSLQAAPNIKVGIFPAASSNYLAFNHKVPALSDVHVRRAISYAVDRAAINKVVYSGLGIPSNSFIAPGVNFYDPKAPGVQFDLKKAAAELAQSKYKTGLKLELLIRGGNKTHEATASIVQASLKKIGITMTIKSQEPSVQRKTQKAMDYQMTLTQWTMDIVDPDQLLTFGLAPDGGTNAFYTNYNNKAVNDAIKKGQVNVDPKVRATAYTFVQKQVADDAFMAFTVNNQYLYAWSNKITGFFVNPLYSYRMENVKKAA